MSLRRPARPLTAPSWNLLAVLVYMEGLPAHISFDDALAHAALRVPLCTGCRMSECQACVTLSDHCLITHEGYIRIRPHEAFLARNVLSHSRRPHSFIGPLFNSDGSRSVLYPVNNLQLHLICSEPLSVGPLFTSRSGTPLTVLMLSHLIYRLSQRVDPTPQVKVRDKRRFASSLSLLHCMDVKILLNAVRWKGSSAFFRRCLSLTSRPTRSVAIPCGVVTPDCDLVDPQAGPSGEASAYSSFTTSASPLSLASVFYINLLYSEGRCSLHRIPLVLLSLIF